MKRVVVVAVVSSALSLIAQDSLSVIHTRWGTVVHKPNALGRAFIQQEAARGEGPTTDLYNRRSAAEATVHLPEVVTVMIQRTSDTDEWVIHLVDVDGNNSSIWVKGNQEKESLPVVGVEPY